MVLYNRIHASFGEDEERIISDDFERYSEMFRTAAAQDMGDYHDAIAGRNVGRIGKNFARSDVDPQTGEKSKEASSRLQRTLDWLLLNDHDYATAHRRLMDAIREAQQTTQHAFARIEEALTLERSLLDDLKSSAARLPDGTLVFRDRDGQVRSADGEIVPAELANGIQWRGDEPSFESYEAQQNCVDDLERARDELLGIERELGEIHTRGSNNDAPLTPEEIERDTEGAQSLRERAEQTLEKVGLSIETPEIGVSDNDTAVTTIGSTASTAIPSVSLGSAR